MTESRAGIVYHAATQQDWGARSAERYQPAGYLDEGFVHASTADQLVATLHRHYPGRQDLLLLTIDPAALTAELVWEDLYGSGVEFPHIYGPVELTAVIEVTPLPCDDDGRFDWWRPSPTS